MTAPRLPLELAPGVTIEVPFHARLLVTLLRASADALERLEAA